MKGTDTHGPLIDSQYFAEKTVSEWHDFLNERFQLDIEFRKFLQYGGDSGAFEQFVSNPVAANLFSLGTNIGDGPPQLKQLDGHAAEEKVTIVFEEKAWKKNKAEHSVGYDIAVRQFAQGYLPFSGLQFFDRFP